MKIPKLRFKDENDQFFSDWKYCKLKNVINQKSRKIKKPNTGYWRLGLRSHGKGTFHEFIEDPDKIAMDHLFLVKENDLILNITFAWEHAIALADKNDEGKLVSHRFPTYEFNAQYFPLFYKYYMLQSRFKFELENISPGGAGRNRVMRKNEFLELVVPCPSFKEQKKIASFLSNVDIKIDLLEKQLDQMETYKKEIIQQIFSKKLRFKDENGNNYPDWKEDTLDKLTFFQEGPGVRNTQYTKKGVKLLNVGNFIKNELDLSTTERYISKEEAYGKYKHFLVDEGDLLIACSGIKADYFNEKIAFAKKEHLPLCMNTSTMRFKPLNKNVIDLNYLKCYFQTEFFKKLIFRVLTGSAQFNFGPTHLKYLKIVIPKLEEQKKIYNFLETLEYKIKLKTKELEINQQFKKGLIQKLFN
jgi:type I restriction enzyme S subunit